LQSVECLIEELPYDFLAFALPRVGFFDVKNTEVGQRLNVLSIQFPRSLVFLFRIAIPLRCLIEQPEIVVRMVEVRSKLDRLLKQLGSCVRLSLLLFLERFLVVLNGFLWQSLLHLGDIDNIRVRGVETGGFIAKWRGLLEKNTEVCRADLVVDFHRLPDRLISFKVYGNIIRPGLKPSELKVAGAVRKCRVYELQGRLLQPDFDTHVSFSS